MIVSFTVQLFCYSSETVVNDHIDTSTEISSTSSKQSLTECAACKLEKFKFSWENETETGNEYNDFKQYCHKDKVLACSKVNFFRQQPQVKTNANQLGLLIGNDFDRSKCNDETMNEMQNRNDKIICLLDMFYNNQAIGKVSYKESDTESTAL